MLEGIKRWLSKEETVTPWVEVATWAKRDGHALRRIKDEDGFVVEGSFGSHAWRLEWGPPQRAYIATRELRLRMELHLPSSLQMLVMSRSLFDRLERETFERYTESMQTQIDVTTPEEMRWLAMFPKLALTTIPRPARNHYAAVASDPSAGALWIDGALSEQLVRAVDGYLVADPAFVMMTLRGRIYLRLELTEPEVESMSAALRTLDAASQSVIRMGTASKEDPSPWPSTTTSAWQTQIPPDDESPSTIKPR